MLADWRTATWITYRRSDDGSNGEVALRRGGQVLDARTTTSAIPDNRIRCIAFQDGDIWVGTAGGLAHGTGKGRMADLEALPAGATGRAPAVPATTAPDPQHVGAVNIGILRPGERTINVPGSGPSGNPRLPWLDQLAVGLAIEQANARGGYRGRIPFALTVGPQGYFRGWGWTTPEDHFPPLANEYGAWGIVCYLGSGSRLTTAAALRTEVPVVNSARTAATIDEIINPWIFRCRGDEPRRHRLLLDYVLDGLGYDRPAVVRTPGALAQMHLDWWSTHAARRGHPVVGDLRFDAATDDLASLVRTLEDCRADVVLTWCDPPTSAAIVRALRAAGMNHLFVGGAQIVGDEFTALAGPDPGPVVAPRLEASRDDPAAARFAEDYMARYKQPPSADAFSLFEAVNHLMEAIETAGLDREAIRHALREMAHDPDGERHREEWPHGPDEIVLGRLEGGGWDFCTLSDLETESP
jgi:hypothetical protein